MLYVHGGTSLVSISIVKSDLSAPSDSEPCPDASDLLNVT